MRIFLNSLRTEPGHLDAIDAKTPERTSLEHTHDNFGNAAGAISGTLEGGSNLPSADQFTTSSYLLLCELQTLSRTIELAKNAIETYRTMCSSLQFLATLVYNHPITPLPISDTPLRNFIEDVRHSPTDKVVYCVAFAIEKMQKRYLKQATSVLGHSVTMAGTASCAIGAITGGITTCISAPLMAAGITLTSLPHIYAGIRCLLKNLQGTTGKDRTAVAEYLWGLGLAKGIRDRVINFEILSPNALQALKTIEMIEHWNTEIAQEHAAEFLKLVRVIDFNSASEEDILCPAKFARSGGDHNPESGGFVKIMNCLRSTF